MDQEETNPRVLEAIEQSQASGGHEAIEAHLEQLRQGWDIVATTSTEAGQVLDWIRPESQVPDGVLAPPPPPEEILPEPFDPDQPTSSVTFELETQPQARGPEGTVPVLRTDASEIPQTMTLQDFFSKHGRPERLIRLADDYEIIAPLGGGTHVYAYSSQSVTCRGSLGTINAWNPYVERNDEFSLGQSFLSRGSGTQRQTVEAGFNHYYALYHDHNLHFFIYYTTNGYSTGGNFLGGYNLTVKGFVQQSSTIFPGAICSQTSSYNGTQYDLRIRLEKASVGWRVYLGSQYVGYYPSALFDAIGLSAQADTCAFFGEVVDSASDWATTRTDMGSGKFPPGHLKQAAYMRNLLYLDPSGNMQSYNPGSVWTTNSACYDIEGHFSSTGSWGSHMWWGGPGRNALCP